MSAQMEKRPSSLFNLFFFVVTTLLIGFVGGLIGGSGGYAALEAPPLAPPGWVFPVVWTALYILMAVAAWLVYESRDEDRIGAIRLYYFQFIVNALWTLFFFRLSWRLFALLWLLLLIALVVLTFLRFRAIRPLAGWLLIPYLAWCIFAAYLNLGFYLLNG